MSQPDEEKAPQDEAPALSTAEERLRGLQQLAVALSAALTVEQVADVIIREGLTALGGNAGSIALLSEDRSEFTTLRCHGYPPPVVAAYARYPYDTALPNADAARTGRALFLGTQAERNTRYPHLAGNTVHGGRGALAALPLAAQGRVFGGLALSFPDDRTFSEHDRSYMQTISQVCAQALERARLFDSARDELAVRRQTEEALRESEARKGAILEAALDCIITIDADERVIEWNPAAEATFGFFRPEALGRPLSELIIPPALRGAHARGITHYLTTGEGPILNRRIEVPALRADGTEFRAELTAVPIPLAGRVLFTAYLRDLTERERAAAQQRAFLRDVFASVTDGKLRLCHAADELPPTRAACGQPVSLSAAAGIGELRHAVGDAAQARGFAEERGHDLVSAVGEAAMNAVVHAGGGVGRLCADENTIQVWVEDRGGGIAVADLPRAALEKGYSSAGTLGHGMKMMLRSADRLWLLTGATGTMVVLEMDRVAPIPPWLRPDVPEHPLQ